MNLMHIPIAMLLRFDGFTRLGFLKFSQVVFDVLRSHFVFREMIFDF